MNDLKLVLKLTLREKKDVSLALVFGFIAGIAGVALLASSGYLISKAALTNQMTILIVMGACLKLFGLTSALSRYAERLFSHRATFTMLGHLRVSFFERLAPLAPGIYQKYRSGDLLARIVGDVESLQNFLLRVFYPPVVLGLVFLSTIFFTSFFSIYIAAVLLVGYLLTTVAVPAFFALRKRKRDWKVRESRALLSTEAAEFLYGFRDLQIYQQLGMKQQQLDGLARELGEEQRKEGFEEVYSQSVNGLVALLMTWIVLGLGAYFTAAGELDGLYLAMLVMISIGVFENIAPMAAFPAYFEESRKAAVRLDQVVEEAPLEKGTNSLPSSPIEMSIENITYRYPDELRPSLDEISISLTPGTKTAVIGPSGSGKSTLMAVMMGILMPDSGSIKLNGEAMHQFDEESLWSRMNVVLQENHFFFGTVKSNLLIADESASDEQLEEVLAKAGLRTFSLSMRVEEKGQNLSGGEKQRLAIARAMLKNQSFWLLDEPLSSVDPVTSRMISKRIFEEHTEDTFLIISHDLSGLERMDQIIVMEQGRIIETGSYDELMGRRGYFYALKEIEKSIMA